MLKRSEKNIQYVHALYLSREDRGIYIKEKMLVKTQVLYFLNLSSVLEDSQK